MAIYFLETSALVKRYVLETGTPWVLDITDPKASHSIYVAEMTLVEAISAIRKAQREGKISASQAGSLISDFKYDFANQYLVLGLTSAIIAQAAELVENHTLRAYDAIQLAVALELLSVSQGIGLPPPVVVSSDAGLNVVAVNKGLVVEDPNNHP